MHAAGAGRHGARARIAAAAGAIVADRGSPVGAVLARSVVSREGLGLALLVAAVATGILVAAVTLRQPGDSRFGLVDGAAVVAIAVVGFELVWGEGDGDLALLMPALITFAAAVLVARVLRPGPASPSGLPAASTLGLRLASLSLARNPGYAVAATAFLVVSFSLAFAESYRATLSRGERDLRARIASCLITLSAGPAAADPGAGRGFVPALSRAARGRGRARAAADGRRRAARGRERDHAARPPAGGAGASERLARERAFARATSSAARLRRRRRNGPRLGPRLLAASPAARSGSSPRSRRPRSGSSASRSATAAA